MNIAELISGAFLLSSFLPEGPIGTWNKSDIDSKLAEVRKVSTSNADRIIRISALFLGTPYRLDPLGEGEGSSEDPDPLFNLAEVDCVTFIEEVMALALSASVEEARKKLPDIRYAEGKPAYASRNHFIEAQWIPNNTRKGYVADITAGIGGEATLIARKVLNAKVWEQRKMGEAGPALAAGQVPNGTFGLPVIPIEFTAEIIDQIPPATILSLVRDDFRSIPYRVTHQGIVVVRHGKRYLRHASRTYAAMVADEPLESYLSRVGAYTRWPVTGINLLRILEKK